MESSIYTGTMPVKGSLYLTSPCMPSAALGNGLHLPNLPYTPIVKTNRELSHSPHLRKTVTTRHKPRMACEIPVGHPASDVVEGSDEKLGRTSCGDKKNSGPATATGIRKEATLGQSILSGSTTTPRTLQPQVKGGMDSFKSLRSMLTKITDQKPGLNSTLLHFGETTEVMNSFTYCKKDPPPLVSVLEQYLQRELGAVVGDEGICTAQSRLRPFREIFCVLADAFPAYGQIMNDIMTAYDGVIQEQAAMLMEALNERQRQERIVTERSAEVQELNSTITRLTAELKEARDELDDDMILPDDEGDLGDVVVQTGKRSVQAFKKLEKSLARSRAVIQRLEEVNKDHLEKILVLISALRESDKRSKDVERDYNDLLIKVEQLNEFKVMAGEAQCELELLKERYNDFISITEHNLIKDQLIDELRVAQNAGRHNRRAAAVRGTQVDVMGRKLKAIQEENAQLLKCDDSLEVLTPRPKWSEVHDKVPSLRDYVKPIKALPLEGDEALTSEVPGMSETVLQVDFLVEQIISLRNELERRKMLPIPMEAPELPLMGRHAGKNIPLHLQAAGFLPFIELDQMNLVTIVYNFFQDSVQSHPDVLLPTFDVTGLYLHYLQSVIEKSPGMDKFWHPQHLAINIDYIAHRREHCRPSLRLLTGILDGIFPSRLACDVMAIVNNVQLELKDLATSQKRTRLRRTALSDCILPVLQLKTSKEIALLRESLGIDTTHDVASLISINSKFMATFFDQECAASMIFYSQLVERITSLSESTDLINGGGTIVAHKKVADAIMELEPLTPRPVITEMMEKSSSKSVADTVHASSLGDMISILGATPIVRRTPRTIEGCVL
uniref:Uncharacterized protein n=1 Tax=Trypanosoma congolense (strain IL3000) TaxID=1068625 RepID=G0UNW7_TRYCI|nr:conserved hypothetical protein [Trypanosoma congolense IL3000]